MANWFRYTGRELDSETGLYYYRARYYDPSVGRFISEDPINFIGGTNFYRYVGNSPLDFVDPFGLCPPDVERCKTAVLNAINRQFGTNLTQSDIQSASLETGGEVNVNFRTSALTLPSLMRSNLADTHRGVPLDSLLDTGLAYIWFLDQALWTRTPSILPIRMSVGLSPCRSLHISILRGPITQ